MHPSTWQVPGPTPQCGDCARPIEATERWCVDSGTWFHRACHLASHCAPFDATKPPSRNVGWLRLYHSLAGYLRHESITPRGDERPWWTLWGCFPLWHLVKPREDLSEDATHVLTVVPAHRWWFALSMLDPERRGWHELDLPALRKRIRGLQDDLAVARSRVAEVPPRAPDREHERAQRRADDLVEDLRAAKESQEFVDQANADWRVREVLARYLLPVLADLKRAGVPFAVVVRAVETSGTDFEHDPCPGYGKREAGFTAIDGDLRSRKRHALDAASGWRASGRLSDDSAISAALRDRALP